MAEESIPLLLWALLIVTTGAVFLWALPGECRCDKCGYHVNQRRMEKERKRELEHDRAHRGPGYERSGKDIYACFDQDCPRNPKIPQ